MIAAYAYVIICIIVNCCMYVIIYVIKIIFKKSSSAFFHFLAGNTKIRRTNVVIRSEGLKVKKYDILEKF